MAISTQAELQQLITQLQITDTPAELHGFLSGLSAGGIQDESWKTLSYQFLNDGHAFSQAPLQTLSELYQQISQTFDEAVLNFQLWQPAEEDGFLLADAISGWTNYFLLGLGLAQPKLSQETDDVGEAIDDLSEIAKLGYSEEDKSEELLEAGEEIVEYLRVVSLFLHSHFARQLTEKPKRLH